MTGELYTLAWFNDEGEFVQYERKGRSWSIFAYDNLTGAKRGRSQSLVGRGPQARRQLKIVKILSMEVVE